MNREKPQRILQVFSSLDKGGAETRVIQMYRHINRDLVQFDFVVTTPGEHFYFDEIRKLGGHIYFLNSWRKVGLQGYAKQWKQLFAEHQYSAVHAHTTIDCGISLYFAKRAGIPVRIAHARNAGVSLSPSMMKKIKDVFLKWLTRRTSTVWIACSSQAAEFVFGKHAVMSKRVLILPDATDLGPFKDLHVNMAEYKKKLQIGDASYVIGTLGNARPVKNHPFLIRVFHAFLRKNPGSMLLIAGRNEDDAEAKQLVSTLQIDKEVRFLGQRNDIPALLSAMDVFIMPSFYEGGPSSVIEAQAANTPCILSDSLTREVDVGSGLVKYVSLNAPLEIWVAEMENSCRMRRPNRETTWHLLTERGYDIESNIDVLMSIYLHTDCQTNMEMDQ